MKINNKNLFILMFLFLVFWLFFVFSDAVLSKQKIQENLTIQKNIEFQNLQQELYQQTEQKQQIEQFSGVEFATIQEQQIIEKTKDDIKKTLDIKPIDISKIELENISNHNGSTTTFEDIRILEELYKTTNNGSIIQILIQKLAQDYQFDKAYQYANHLITSSGMQSIEANLYLSIWLNSSELSVMQLQSINKLRSKIDAYRSRWQLTTDDYRFYQAMIFLRNQDYEWAITLLKQITSPRYDGFYDSIVWIHQQINQQQDMPKYYENALIALQLLKEWYFVHAKKLSLDVLVEDENYILPYQVLAYSAFLTNSRDDAIDYFLKLTDLDRQKSDRYKFFIGVSYFWLDDTENSVLYLSQIEDKILEDKDSNLKELLTDTYRYLLLNYRKANDQTYMINTRQKLLWQTDLEKSDFYLYFYETFFKPLSIWEEYFLYHKNPTIANDYVDKCYKVLINKAQDICLYGHAGFDFLNNNFDKAEKKLLYIAKYYPQSYIFHTLWDLYRKKNNLEKAKNYYIKAVSITAESGEQIILQWKISEVIDGW